MKLVLRALTLWLLLAGFTWLFVSAGQNSVTLPSGLGSVTVQGGFRSWLTLALGTAMIPAFCMWLTITSVPLLPRRWPGRLVFWMGTVVVWFALAVMMQGRAETDRAGRVAVLFGAVVTGVTAVWLLCKVRPFPVWRVMGEIALVAALWGAIGDVVLTSYRAETRVLQERAGARWAEIGLPMTEFAKTLVVGKENAGSEVVRDVLRKQVGAHFYKPGTRAGAQEPAVEPSGEAKKILLDAGAITGATRAPADDLDLSLLPVASVEPLAASLDADYRRILAAEPAIWASDPSDGLSISVPNFLGLRSFALLAGADAMRRLSAGDQEGAARAISAGRRMSVSLRQNPTIVSLMIHVAVEAMLASKLAYLPASVDGLQTAAVDAADLRAEFLRRLQLEGWTSLRLADEASNQEVRGGPLPRWLERIQGPTWWRRQMMIGTLNYAEHAAILKDPATLTLPDLGMSRHDAISEKSPSIVEMNVSRALMRLTATLLLREQVELIRLARARLAAGMPMEPYQSAVIPNARWELTIDKEKAAVSTRLFGAPEWIVNDVVTTPAFWCLRLDGSETWQFHRDQGATGDQ